MASFYANENFPFPVVEELRRLGHDVVTTRDAGNSGTAISDADVLEFATKQGRAVLTLNRKHFITLRRQRPSYAGIVVCTVDRDFMAQARRIHRHLADRQTLDGELIRVNRPG